MASAMTALLSAQNQADNTVFTTASVQPTANGLCLLAVFSRDTTGTPDIPVVTGTNTFTEINTATTGTVRCTLLRHLSASPANATITMTFATTQSEVNWHVVECSEVVTTGSNGADAVLQSAVATGATSPFSVTLAAFADATHNVAFGAFNKQATGAYTPGSGFTELTDLASGASAGTTEWRLGEDTTVDVTATNVNWAGVAIEIASSNAVVAPRVPADDPFPFAPSAPDSTLAIATQLEWPIRGEDASPNGPWHPSYAANDAGAGDVAWSTPERARYIDDGAAAAVVTAIQTSQRLNLTGAGIAGARFQIPAEHQIQGVLVEALSSTNIASLDLAGRLIVGGVIDATNVRTVAVGPATIYRNLGGTSDTWGITPTPAQVNATPDFGISLRIETPPLATETMQILAVRITVYHGLGATGTGAVTLPAITAAASVTQTTFTSTAAVTLPAIAAAAAVTQTNAATADVTLPAITAAASVTQTNTVAGASTLPALTAAGQLEVVLAFLEGAVTLPSLTASATATQTIGATAAVTLPALTATVAASMLPDLVGGVTLPALTATAAATQTQELSGAVTLPAVTAAATVTQGMEATAAVTLAAITAQASVTQTNTLTGSVTLPALTAAAVSTQTQQLTGSLTLPAVTAVASATQTISAAGAVTLPAITALAAAGVVPTATAAVTLPMLVALAALYAEVGLTPMSLGPGSATAGQSGEGTGRAGQVGKGSGRSALGGRGGGAAGQTARGTGRSGMLGRGSGRT